MTTKSENFYDQWLNMWEDSEREKKNARCVIHDDELEWVETPQDYRIALMAGPENGFRTWGTEVTIAEIPAGSHTGKHEHGEEGIYIAEGEGFSIVNGIKYEWQKDSVLWMPFGSQHQHFNTGSGTARYLSYSALHLEHFAGLARVDQWEIKGFTDTPIDAEVSSDGLDKLGRRISISGEVPITIFTGEESALEIPIESNAALADPNAAAPLATGAHRDRHRVYMQRGANNNAWANREIEISSMNGDMPGRHGGKHAHMEAFLYIVDGEGYSVVNGAKVPWKKGSLLHVQGPQTEHQHFNPTDQPSTMLRLAPGLRFNFLQPIARERFPYLVWGGRGKTDPDD